MTKEPLQIKRQNRKIGQKIYKHILKRSNRNGQKAHQRLWNLSGSQRNANEGNNELPLLPFRLSEAVFRLSKAVSSPSVGTAVVKHPVGGSTHQPSLSGWQIVHRYQEAWHFFFERLRSQQLHFSDFLLRESLDMHIKLWTLCSLQYYFWRFYLLLIMHNAWYRDTILIHNTKFKEYKSE